LRTGATAPVRHLRKTIVSAIVGPQSTVSASGLSQAEPRDYFSLLKPRVMSLVVLTALTGLMLAPGPLNPVIAFASLLAIAVGAGASGCLNMWYDADIDAVMARTASRPIPAGRIAPQEALAFGLTLSVGSVLFLGIVANWFAAGFLAFTIFFYAVVYSMWLKRWTGQNIVIGGAAGAFPPMIGYAAMTGTVDLTSFVLFFIIFMWTPPHFWALALLRTSDYARAGVPMLPVVAGPDATRLQILVYTILLAPIGVLPAAMGFAGPVYAAVAVVTGARMIQRAWAVYRIREGQDAARACGRLFGYSILYLFGLFGVLLAEEVLGRFGITASALLRAVTGSL
jgi:protoheme IX farnesyltransferase